MANSKAAADLAQQVVQGTGVSQKTSATPAGQTEANGDNKDELIEAINQVFALFRLNYHNQFYAAYSDGEQLNQIKRLWLESLSAFSAQTILLGARHAIENSEYLPTLHRMLESCQEGLRHQGLPSARDAFFEACQQPSPKHQQHWTHPAVYWAGRDSGWYFLANNTEANTWPIFKRQYEAYVAKVLRGDELMMPTPEALPDPHTSSPMTTAERQAALTALRDDIGL